MPAQADDRTMTRVDCSGISLDDPAGSDAIGRAYDMLTKHGFVVLDHVLPVDTVTALREEFAGRYARYLQNREYDDTLKVGNMRYMITVDLSGGFADPLVYANPHVLALARQALDQDAILESFGAVVSLAGSRQQHVHRDGRVLFDASIAPLLPAHALTFVLPLVDMNDANGSTAVWPGSHRWKTRDENAPPVTLDVPVGSCALWDFRLYHSGTANRSNGPRPIIYATYSRHWYRDTHNFEKSGQQHLSFAENFLAGMTEDRRTLFAHVHGAVPEQ